MKKQHILSIALVCIGLFTSCNQSPIEDLSEKASKSREVIFNIGISPITRTVTDGLKSSFVSNDKIGISGINDGIYILRISGTDFSNTYKLIKNRP